MALSEWVSVADAATLVNRSPDALYLWVRQGKLRAQRDGMGRTRVDAREVLRVEASQRLGRPVGTPSFRGAKQ